MLVPDVVELLLRHLSLLAEPPHQFTHARDLKDKHRKFMRVMLSRDRVEGLCLCFQQVVLLALLSNLLVGQAKGSLEVVHPPSVAIQAEVSKLKNFRQIDVILQEMRFMILVLSGIPLFFLLTL